MGNLVQYESYTVEDAEENEQELSKGSSEFMKLAVGRNVVRVLPAMPGRKVFKVVSQHYLDVSGMDSAAVVVCPRLMNKEECPICSKVEELRRSGNPTDKKLADRMYARKRVYCNVVDRKEPEAGPKVLNFGKSIQDQINKIRKDPDGGGDFADPVNGFDLIIERTGTGPTDTEYTVLPARAVSKLSKDTDTANAWIENSADLETYANLMTLPQMREVLMGLNAPEEQGGGRRQLSGPRGGGGGQQRRPAPAPQAKRRSIEEDAESEGEVEGELDES